jgi:hypothetical protein
VTVTSNDIVQRWVRPEHLSPDAVQDYRARFEAHPARLLVIENFLLDKRDQPAWHDTEDWRSQFELD